MESSDLIDSSRIDPQANSSSYQENNDPIVKSTDMPDVMQSHAISCTQKAIEQSKEEGCKKSEFHNFLAKKIKKEFDASYGGVWHCIVGRNFGSFVVHQSRTFIYFYLGQTAVLLFKSGSQSL